jgi:hypothetical protein
MRIMYPRRALLAKLQFFFFYRSTKIILDTLFSLLRLSFLFLSFCSCDLVENDIIMDHITSFSARLIFRRFIFFAFIDHVLSICTLHSRDSTKLWSNLRPMNMHHMIKYREEKIEEILRPDK